MIATTVSLLHCPKSSPAIRSTAIACTLHQHRVYSHSQSLPGYIYCVECFQSMHSCIYIRHIIAYSSDISYACLRMRRVFPVPAYAHIHKTYNTCLYVCAEWFQSLYTRLYIRYLIDIHISMYKLPYTCIHTHVYKTCMYVWMYVCIYLSIYPSVYLCIYVSMYLCIYVSMYM